jgi:hypothetical protein
MEKIFERRMADVGNLKRRSLSVASMIVEN